MEKPLLLHAVFFVLVKRSGCFRIMFSGVFFVLVEGVFVAPVKRLMSVELSVCFPLL